MIRVLALLIACSFLVAGCARATTSRDVADACPLPLGAQGFPLTTRAEGGSLTPERLSSVANAVASAWPRMKKDGSNYRLTIAQQLAALAYEKGSDAYDVHARHGWTPAKDDTATIVLSYSSNASTPAITLQGVRDTTRFQRMALAAVTEAREDARRGIPQRDTLPLQLLTTPASGPFSIRLHFGTEPGPGDGVARFTVTEREATAVASTQRVPYPELARSAGMEGEVVLTYGVRPDGRADLSTVYVVKATSSEFRDAVLQQLGTFRFRPAERNCRPVFQLVQQPFRFSLNWGMGARP